MKLEFTIDGIEPVPKERPRVYRGRAFTPKRTRDWEEIVRRAAYDTALFDPPFGFIKLYGPLSVEIDVVRGTCRRVDLDNLVKAILDGLNKSGIWLDDSQVHRLVATKTVDAKKPSVRVVIEEMDPWPSSVPSVKTLKSKTATPGSIT